MDEQLVRYENFDLQIVREGRKYCGRVLSSPAGSGAESRFTLPFSAAELQQMRSLHLPDLPTIQHFGKTLYERVCADQVRTLLISCLNDLQQAAMNQPMGPQLGLRIRIRCVHVPELATLPWEYLYVTELGQFLGLCERVTIVRYLDVARPTEPLPVQPPLRMLVLTASPSDYPLLNVDQEWQRLQASLQPLTESGLLQLAYLEKATFAQVRRQLAQGPFHILHYIGHGGLEARSDRGVLILENEQGESQQISGLQLTQLLANQTSLKLVVLNACEGARTLDNDTFAGIAQSLVLGGIPAVIAMQFVITDAAATHFSPEFYGCLARGLAIDSALLQARITLFTQPNEAEWGTPVLFLRTDDGVIFALEKTTPSLSIASRSSTTSIEQPALVAEPVESPPMSPSEAVPADSATQIPQIPQPLPPAHPKSLFERFIHWLGRLDPTQIAVAIITAIVGPILIYLVTANNSSPPPPTPFPTLITPSVIAPGVVPTDTAPITPTLPAVSTTVPTAVLAQPPAPPLRIGVAPFADCNDPQFASRLQNELTLTLQNHHINIKSFQFTNLPSVHTSGDQNAQHDQDIVIWGDCLPSNQVNYHADFLIVNHRPKYRVADPVELELTWDLQSLSTPALVLAGALAYFAEGVPHDFAAKLLNQASGEWNRLEDAHQLVRLHWLLGNAWLGHSVPLQDEALIQYARALEHLKTVADEQLHNEIAKQLHNNRGLAYLQQGRRFQRYQDLGDHTLLLVEARKAFSEALQLDQAYLVAWVGHSESYLHKYDFEAAFQDCKQAAKVRSNALTYTCMARAYYIAERYREMAEAAQKAISFDERYTPALFFAGYGFCAMGDVQQAVMMFESFVEQSSTFSRQQGWSLAIAVEVVQEDINKISIGVLC
jgi:tetratricopeptide (TPR) repeat protein